MTQTLGAPVLPVVRVAILAERRLTEVALPAQLPLREILPAVQRLLRSADDDGDTDVTPQPLSLAPIGGAPFSLEASLDTVGVVDGDLLALQPVPAGPAAPGIVEDIADAAALFGSRQHSWGQSHIEHGARAGLIALLLAGTGVSVAHRLATGSAAGLYVVSAVALVAVVGALLLRARDRRGAVAVSITALIPIAAAFILAVPGDFGAAHLLLAAAGVTAWSLISMIIGKDALAFFTATTVVGGGVLLAAAAATLWNPPPLTVGCALVVLALLVTVQTAQLSALWARFPLPVIPAPGDPAPSAPALAVLTDLPHRVRVSAAHQTGFIAGAVVLSVLGSVTIVGRTETPSPWAWYVVAAVALASVLRARIWDTVACKAWLLAQPVLLLSTLLVVFGVQGRHTAALWTVVALAALVLVWVAVATNPRLAAPESYSLPMRRLVGFIASGIDASLLPVLAYLVGLFAWVLER